MNHVWRKLKVLLPFEIFAKREGRLTGREAASRGPSALVDYTC